MEITQPSLLEELIVAPNIDNYWTPFPNEFLSNTWSFAPFDQTPTDLYSQPTNPSLLELISPSDLITNQCPLGPFQPFLDALTLPDQLSSFYDNIDDVPIEEECVAAKLENSEFGFVDNGLINGFDDGILISSFKPESDVQVDGANLEEINNINVGLCGEKKNKLKRPNGQPSKNLMAERRRRKRLNDRLAMLRSIVPKISKMDRTSILGDTIDYMKELLDKINNLREEISMDNHEDLNPNINLNIGKDDLKDLKPNEMLARNPPKFSVQRKNDDTRVEVCCTARPGLLISTLSTMDALGLDIQQCVISCFNDFSLQASCYEAAEQQSIVSSEDVKQALFRNAGYGGRCL